MQLTTPKFFGFVLALFCHVAISAQCSAPMNLSADNLGATTATLNWTSGNADIANHCWTVSVGTLGFNCTIPEQALQTIEVCNGDAGLNVDGLNLSVNVSGLSASTPYQFAVVETCDGNDGDSGQCVTSAPFFTLAPAETFQANLSGHQEVLPVATRAFGLITATIEDNTLIVSGNFNNLSSPLNTSIGGGAHIHIGYAGQNGSVALVLTPTVSGSGTDGTFDPAMNSFPLDADQLETLRGRRMYVNIHSINYPTGELRGQLLPDAEQYYSVTLFGSNEVPSVLTKASGALAIEIDNGQMTISGSFQNLASDFVTGTGAKINFGFAGQNGDEAITLNATPDPDLRNGIIAAANNVYNLNPDLNASLRNRRLYANFSTEDQPNGEIRGQLTAPAQAVFRAHLSGSNEWPYVNSRGEGQLIAELFSNDSILISGSFANMGSAVNTAIAGGIHVHYGPAGSNGPVVLPLTFSEQDGGTGAWFFPNNNGFGLTSGQVDTMLERQFYVNVHSIDNPAGELRGQLLNESQAVFTGILSGTQEPGNVNTDGRGAIKIEMSGGNLTASGSYTELTEGLNTAILGGVHIHRGFPGETGPVVEPLVPSFEGDSTAGVFLASENRYSLDVVFIDSLIDRGLYINVHSLAFPGGEIRGALLAEAMSYFFAPLSGTSETNPVDTDAEGMIAFEMRDTELMAVGSFAGLESDFATDIAGGAHLHDNLAGSNSGVDFLLNSTIAEDNRSALFLIADNTLNLTEGQLDSLLDRFYYVNIHSIDNASGELRGQVLPLADSYFHTSLSGLNEVPLVNSGGIGSLKLELTQDQLVVTGSFSNLDGDFDANIGGGAHLHLGPAGENGPVAIPIVATLAGDLRSGYFLAEDNSFNLSNEDASAIKSGNIYANIHTTAVQSGELRGQIVPEQNLFPDASTIEAPMEGANILIEGDFNTEFTADWSDAADIDPNTVVYTWQLAADANFETVILTVNTGVESFFTTNFGTVDMLLSDAGVGIGSSITLYHRAISSDGSNNTIGAGASVVLERGVITDTDDNLPDGFDALLYPNISTGEQLQLEVETEERFTGNIVLVDQLGRILYQQPQDFISGLNRALIETQRLSVGTYFLYLRTDSGIIYQTKIIRQ